MASSDSAIRRYTGVTTALTKREGRVKVRMSYTWSQLNGTVTGGGSNTPFNDIPGRDVYLSGPLADDHRHEIKAMAVLQATQWLMFGVRYSYYSGLPYSRLYRNVETGNFEDYRATRGTNPGSNINDPGDDRALRLPDMQDLGLQSRINLRPLIGQRIEFFVDLLNILALRTTTGVEQTDIPTFGQVTSRLEPFRARVGFNFKY